MTRIGMVGDVHGWYPSVKRCLLGIKKVAPEVTIVHQLGDFGLYDTRESQDYYDLVNDRLAKMGMTMYVTPGNHEDWGYIEGILDGTEWAYLRDNIVILARGTTDEIGSSKFISLGGAPSVDRTYRQQHGWPWSAGEAITLHDLMKMTRADVMLAHDAPWGSQTIMERIGSNPFGFAERDLEYADEGRDIMTEAVNIVRPKIFFHGHYHFPVNEEVTTGLAEFRQIGLNADAKDHSAGVFNPETLEYQSIVWSSGTGARLV